MSAELQEGIADIVLPLVPVDMLHFVMLSSLALVVVVIFIIVVWRQYNSKRLRCLRDLRHATKYGHIPCRNIVYEIAAILRRRTGLQRLDASSSLPASLLSQRERWGAFMQILQSWRYSKQSPSAQDVLQLRHEAEYWIRKWS